MLLTFILFFIVMTDEEKKEKKREYDKMYRLKNKEKIAAKKRKWYDDNKEHKRQYDIIYRAENVTRRKEIKAEWNIKNKEKMSEYNQQYYGALDGLAKRRRNHYLYEDKKFGFDKDKTVTAEWIRENILTGKCIYCGDSEPSHLGCDRIDNSDGHNKDNVVCSCPVCNWERSLEKMSVEEFIEYRKTHPRMKENMNDGLDRKTGERKK